jgi:hypothetical protein
VISRRGPIQPRKPKNQGHQQGHNLSIYSMFWYHQTTSIPIKYNCCKLTHRINKLFCTLNH